MSNMKVTSTITSILVINALLLVFSATSTTITTTTTPVLDTAGEPLRRGVEYVIAPAITDVGGRFTLIDRNNSCIFYAGQENSDADQGSPVIFEPLDEEETLVRVSRDLKVTFFVFTTCMTSTTWQLAETEPKSQRRLIGTGSTNDARNYFRIESIEEPFPMEGIYLIRWCPYEFCPTCKFDCGTVGSLIEDGNRLLALDGSVIPVVFERA